MGDVKRWTVTYTKHVKQKRKVYQDGRLELHPSTGTHKVLLYDDSQKLLESRFLKSSDLVRCGEALTFGSYLVDIGDLDNNCNPQSRENCDGRQTGDSSYSMESKNSDLGHNLASENHPNVRHNIKKEGEKSAPGRNVRSRHLPTVRYNIKKEGESSGFGTHVAPKNFSSLKRNIEKESEKSVPGNKAAPENHPSMKDNLKKEWRVLYTPQKTQKAKKYHDGMLRLVIGVLDRKQVFLYDDCQKQLESRYLKKDELVGCGETLTFDGYLVEIGDPEENCKPLSDLNILGSEKKPIENIGRLNDRGKNGSRQSITHGSCPSVTNSTKKEWHVLYTTQKTQKAKMYHDGILRLLFGIANRKQVILLSEEGISLGSKYLSLSEDVGTGCVLELANHLVEVGEARVSEEGDGVVAVHKIDKMEHKDTIIRNTTATFGVAGIHNNSSSGKDLNSYSSGPKVMNAKCESGVRDAQQILSILKRPNGVSISPRKEPLMHHISSSQVDLSFSGRNFSEKSEEKLENNLEILNKVTQVPDDVIWDVSDDKFVTSDGYDGGLQVKECHLFTGAEVSCGNSGQSANAVPNENSDQLSADKTITECKVDEFTLPSQKNSSSTNEFPSFDLGFSQ